MGARVTWSGLDELKEGLRNLPAELAGESANEIEAAANAAAVSVRANYGSHRRTGNLQGSVTVTHQRSSFGVVSIVKASARHAALFEYGTQARHTAIGANRGSMPPGHAFLPPVIQQRRSMYERLKDVLRRAGLTVSGDA